MSLFSGRPIHYGQICGFYSTINSIRKYLPQVKLEVHSSIISSISRTTLTQTFVSPSDGSNLDEIRYTFPLFDGVSVVSFVCTVGDRVIHGVVKERQKARETYDAAIAQGKTAGLLEQLPDASDVFTTTVGNVPAGAEIKVDITYLGELKHDAQVDGIRLTIPTVIAPRYASYPGQLLASNTSTNGGIRITVDAEVPDGSTIDSIQSPSHQIAVSLGRTSVAPMAQPSFQRASATLALGSAELEKDFILQLVATNTGNPMAILEQHPSMPNQRALMTTLVPKFSLKSEKPEVVFVCDQSGSMCGGGKIPNLKAALQIFVKSLTPGVKFNICSFGSNFTFLWERSRTYDQSSVTEAMRHIDTFGASYGGTDIYHPLEETFNRRYTDMNLEVFLLTDGEVWNQSELFQMINDTVASTKGAVRVFTLGIGRDVSHALIEGVARAGNGFSQSVSENEDMSSKAVRMLKGAMFPHINDYSLEVKYEIKAKANSTELEDGDFEVVEKVLDGLIIKDSDTSTAESIFTNETAKKPISLFDPSTDLDVEMKDDNKDAEDRYAHLPPLDPPKLLQAPFNIPSLFPFNRTTVYLLLSPDTVQKTPKSVILRGTSTQGPLELEIPVTVLEQPGETIHQLAAKKSIGELEEGRGWIYHAKIYHAKTPEGTLLKDKYDGRFPDMVEREGVRLGVKYQVGGKWCSFVAVEGDEDVSAEAQSASRHEVESEMQSLAPGSAVRNAGGVMTQSFGRPQSGAPGYPVKQFSQRTISCAKKTGGSSNGVLFGSTSPPPPPAPRSTIGELFGGGSQRMSTAQGGSGLFGTKSSAPAAASLFASTQSSPSTGGAFGRIEAQQQAQQQASFLAAKEGCGLFGAQSPTPARTSLFAQPQSSAPTRGFGTPSAFGTPAAFGVGGHSPQKNASLFGNAASQPPVQNSALFGSILPQSSLNSETEIPESFSPPGPLPSDKLQALVMLQTFEGYWAWSDQLLRAMGWNENFATNRSEWWSQDATNAHLLAGAVGRNLLATAMVVAWLRKERAAQKDAWELLVDKAVAWMEDALPQAGIGMDVETLVARVGGLF